MKRLILASTLMLGIATSAQAFEEAREIIDLVNQDTISSLEDTYLATKWILYTNDKFTFLTTKDNKVQLVKNQETNEIIIRDHELVYQINGEQSKAISNLFSRIKSK